MAHTFHDLRRFAAAAPRPASIGEGDAFLAARRPLPVADAATAVFAMDLPAGSGRVETLGADEFVLVLEGEIVLTTADGVAREFERDDSFVLTKASGFTWSARRGATLIVLAYPGGGGAGALHRVDRAAELSPCPPPPVELLVGDAPACGSHPVYRSTDGEFTAGLWAASPYHRRRTRYAHCELMHLLEGSVTFVDETGREAEFRAGDVFFVEAGAQSSWHSRTPVRKVYAIHRPG